MSQSIPIDVYQFLEERVGKEEAKKVAAAVEVGLDVIEKKAEAVALQKKLEIKDELTKELVTKAEFFGEIKSLRQEMQTVKIELEAKIENGLLKLDRKFTIMFVILFFTIIFVNRDALEFMAKVLGLIK